MPKTRANTNRNTRNNMFVGDSNDLKFYLRKKKESLEVIAKNSQTSKEAERVMGFVYVIDDVLKLKYFRTAKIRLMPKLIEDVKADREELRNKLAKLMEEEGPRVERLNEVAKKALHDSGGYIANKYEPGYATSEQEALRDAIDEFHEAQYFYENDVDELQHKIKVHWWLLGIIHQPVKFFKNAVTDEK